MIANEHEQLNQNKVYDKWMTGMKLNIQNFHTHINIFRDR